MENESTQSTDLLLNKVNAGIDRARAVVSRSRRLNTTLGAITIIAGALSTVLAGASAAIGEGLVGSGTPGWRITCGIVAGITLVSTITTGLSQQFKVSETLERSRICVARLNALQVALSLGSTPLDAATKTYTEITTEFASVLE